MKTITDRFHSYRLGDHERLAADEATWSLERLIRVGDWYRRRVRVLEALVAELIDAHPDPKATKKLAELAEARLHREVIERSMIPLGPGRSTVEERLAAYEAHQEMDELRSWRDRDVMHQQHVTIEELQREIAILRGNTNDQTNVSETP